MQVTFWGVRGSHPVPGPQTVRYGGETSCVEVRANSGKRIIIDAGTGLRALGEQIMQEAAKDPKFVPEFEILLSHVHWDHIQGLPFFRPLWLPGARVTIHMLRAAEDSLHDVIAGAARKEFFPASLAAIPAQFTFSEVHPGQAFDIFDFTLLPISLNHPLGAVGYRVQGAGAALAYVCDTAPFCDILHKRHFLKGMEPLTDADRAALGTMEQNLIAALQGVDTVIYDTHFTQEEYTRFPHYGHSTPDQALQTCIGTGVHTLVLYHHAPSHHDEMMDELAVKYAEMGLQHGIEVIASRQGMTLVVAGKAKHRLRKTAKNAPSLVPASFATPKRKANRTAPHAKRAPL